MISQWKQDARGLLSRAGNTPRKLAFLSTAVALGASVLGAVLGQLVEQYQGSAGLSGMGTASVLQTVELIFSATVQTLTPFWTLGLVAALFLVGHGRKADRDDLFTGLRRFAVFLRLMLLEGLLVGLIAFLMYTPASLIYGFSPWGSRLAQLVLTWEEADLETVVAANIDQLLPLVAPLVVIYLGLLLVVYLPIRYRLRFSRYLILAGMNRALLAMLVSHRGSKGHVWSLVKLDLSFWWYYVAKGALLVVCFLDLLGPLVGIHLPWSAGVNYWVSYLAYALGTLALETLARPLVEVTNVACFRSLAEIPQE